MSDKIPQWAIERASDLANAEDHQVKWTYKSFSESPALQAFARYIAEHEEAPVDPLLIEARKIGEEYCPTTTNRYATGELDEHASTRALVAAIKRGMELAEQR